MDEVALQMLVRRIADALVTAKLVAAVDAGDARLLLERELRVVLASETARVVGAAFARGIRPRGDKEV